MTTAVDDVDDALWSAIGDPVRRRLLDMLLTDGGGTATSLSDRLPVSRQAVTKHLGVLGRAGLVHGVTAGRERHYEISETQFARAVTQLNAVGTAWDSRLARIKRIAETIERSRRSAQDQEHEGRTGRG